MDEAGLCWSVRELLVVSKDTSAYGVDLKYQTDFWQGRPTEEQSGESHFFIELGI